MYRKKTHTDQYLSFESHHPLIHKLGVVRTLLDRKDRVVQEEEDKKQEHQHIVSALKNCGYPEWSVHKVQQQMRTKKNTTSHTKKKQENEEKSRGHITIPYVEGLSERLSRSLRKCNIGVSFRPEVTLRKLLVHPKDKQKDQDRTGVVYKVDCKNCPKAYIGETSRKLSIRLNEHKGDIIKNASQHVRTRSTRTHDHHVQHSSAITDHVQQTNHQPDIENTAIVARENDDTKRRIKECIWIRKTVNMNRDEGNYQLPHIYDDILKLIPSKKGGPDSDAGLLEQLALTSYLAVPVSALMMDSSFGAEKFWH